MKNIVAFYEPVAQTTWIGRSDSLPRERFFQVVQTVDLNITSLAELASPSFAFIGFCSDEGVQRNQGRPGAKDGPLSLRSSLSNLPLHLQSPFNFYDLGNIVCTNKKLEDAQAALASLVCDTIKQGIFPIVIGGGHEVAWGSYCGIRDALASQPFAVFNFDAHFDLRPLDKKIGNTSGTPFLQMIHDAMHHSSSLAYFCYGIQKSGNTASLFATAQQHQVEYVLADDIHLGVTTAQSKTEKFISQHAKIFVSLCLDVFSQQLAPGVSAPQPLGLSAMQVIPVLRKLANSGKAVLLDVAELAPILDQNKSTSLLAANLISEFIHHSLIHRARSHK